MMGSSDTSQKPLFYAFNLDDVVPQDHLLRHIDRFPDLSDLRQHLAPYYSHSGRPSVDPELMIRMLLIGYCLGIRSERRLRDVCSLKQRCCANTTFRKIARSIHESARDVAREVAKTPAYRRTRRQRKQVEMLFGHMKRILKVDRLRLRGLSGAQDEFLLTATAQNLRRMAKNLGTGPPVVSGMT